MNSGMISFRGLPLGLALAGVGLALAGVGGAKAGASQEPLETRALGRFEVTARLEPARPIPGEDLFLWVSVQAIAPFQQGPKSLALEDLASQIGSGFAGKFRIQSLKEDLPPAEPESGRGPSGTTWVFGFRLIPLKDERGEYPGEIPEFGLVTTRDDIPWPRLARQIVWIGPLPLRYAQPGVTGSPSGDPNKSPWYWLLLGPVIPLMGGILYESWKWHRDVAGARAQLLAPDGTSPQSLRKAMLEWLEARGVQLSAEPLPERIEVAVRQAGYPANRASHSRQLWEKFNASAFGTNPVPSQDLAHACCAWLSSWAWVPWRRRLNPRPG
jgi:hypothetical protein